MPPPPRICGEFKDDLGTLGTDGISSKWLSRLQRLQAVSSSLRHTNEVLMESLHPQVAAVHRKASLEGAHVEALLAALLWTDHPDHNLSDDLKHGFPLAGRLPLSHLWPDLEQAVSPMDPDDIAEALKSHPPVCRPRSRSSAKESDFEIWRLTLEEASTGRMSQPRRCKPSDFSSGSPLTRRFGVTQLTSKGVLKIRCIDDFTASLVNLSACTDEKLFHNHLDDLISLVDFIAEAGHLSLLIKADFKGAYRTCPVHPLHYKFSRVLIWNPHDGHWYVSSQYALPFGAIASVYGWERLGAAITSILHWIGLPVLRYVDDLFFAVPHCLGILARSVLTQAVEALGYTLEKDKTEGPSSALTILGLHTSIHSDHLEISPDEAKRAHWCQQMDSALLSDSLSPPEAAKLAGRLNFAASSIFGRLAAAPLRSIYERQHSHARTHELNHQLRIDILYMKELLVKVTFRRSLALPLRRLRKNVLLTDATGLGKIGYALYSDSIKPSAWSHGDAANVSKLLNPRLNQVTAYELLAPLWSLQNLPQLKDHAVDLYVDNTTAEAILRKGASSSDDLNSFAAQFWATALQMNLSVRVFRVPSKLNTADEASRFLSQGKAPPLASRFLRSRQLKVIKTLARHSVFSNYPRLFP